jgi:hypothetical protein
MRLFLTKVTNFFFMYLQCWILSTYDGIFCESSEIDGNWQVKYR